MHAAIVKERRLSLGLTQGDVARTARVSKRSVMRVEAGEIVQPSTLRVVCHAVGVEYVEQAKISREDPEPARLPTSRTIPLVSVRGTTHPLMTDFVEALGTVTDIDLVVLPDVEDFMVRGKPKMREAITRMSPARTWRDLCFLARVDPAKVILSLVVLLTLALFLLMLLASFGWQVLGAVPLLAVTANLAMVSWNRARHGSRLARLERTAFAFGKHQVTVVEVHPEGTRLTEHWIEKHKFQRIRLGSSSTYRGLELLTGDVTLRALPDDPRVEARLVDRNPFHDGVWLPKFGVSGLIG